ncbi:AMP-binding protein [Promicromonospora kroppenstedtii]|uniref:AMP-binding protein n=1 Tax=Promicromonospora kroppenstedtii TaxID=440482 RepID=A0ABW7XPV8_9MICO
MTRRIVTLDDTADSLLDRIRAVRAAGDVPLVADSRWPAAQRTAVDDLVRAAEPPAGAAWATLTSGSSGTSRVVVRTEESWARSFAAVSALLDDPSASDAAPVVALPAPASSSLTLFSLAHALAGGPHPALPGDDAGLAAATAFHGTPHALRTLLERGALPRVRTALVGGSHLDQRVRALAESRGVRVVAYYGAAELSFVAADDGTGLRPFLGVEVDVRDGQVWVRSPYAALGYLGDAGPLRTDGPWATVGDLADLRDGTLTLRGRADGAILSASATVVPEEVEAHLRRLPGVRDAVVFGYPAGGVGALVAAVVEPAAGRAPVSAGLLRETAASGMSPSHRPRIWFTGDLPRTAAGKPARAEVVRRALAGEVRRVVG